MGHRRATSSRRASTPAPCYVDRRPAPGEQPRSVRLQDDRLRQDLEGDRGDIPKSLLSATRTCVREDPFRRGAALSPAPRTRSTSRSTTAQHWQPLQSGLPHAPVYWLTVQEHFHDLVVATYGRGFYILDDVTPLRTLSPETLGQTAHLFEPRARVPLPDDHRSDDDARRPDRGEESAVRREPQFLPARRRRGDDGNARRGQAGDQRRRRQGGPDDQGREGRGRRHQSRVVGPAHGSDDGLQAAHAAARTSPTSRWRADGTRKFPTGGPLSALVPPGTYTVKLTVAGADRVAADRGPQGSQYRGHRAGHPGADEADDDDPATTRATTTKAINEAERCAQQIAQVKKVAGDDDAREGRGASAADDLDAKIARDRVAPVQHHGDRPRAGPAAHCRAR